MIEEDGQKSRRTENYGRATASGRGDKEALSLPKLEHNASSGEFPLVDDSDRPLSPATDVFREKVDERDMELFSEDSQSNGISKINETIGDIHQGEGFQLGRPGDRRF